MLDLEPIKKLLGEITPGTWRDTITDDGGLVVYLTEPPEGKPYGCNYLFFGDMEETEGVDHANAEFVADAPATVAALVAEVEQLRAALLKIAAPDYNQLNAYEDLCAVVKVAFEALE